MAKVHGIIYSSVKNPHHPRLNCNTRGLVPREFSHRQPFWLKLKLSGKGKLITCEKLNGSRAASFLCRSRETQTAETKESVGHNEDCSDNFSRTEGGDGQHFHPERIGVTNRALAEACKFAYNDARYVNERAKSDLFLLSRGIRKLDARARQDVAILGSGFLMLDARAREDTEKIDNDVKKRAENLHHIALILHNKAQSKLKSVADRHWSDGALEADLRRADYIAKQRAMEDVLMALEFIKDVHDMMISKMYELKNGALSSDDMAGQITLEKNGMVLDFFLGEVSTDRITAIQEAYRDMASALSEVDGIDYTDPEELELLVATLMDLDAMDGKGSVSLLAECSSSPDVNTRKALANALSVAPSMWTLGNAGMGALQRLAEDSNPTIAAAASKTISELKRQWEIEEGDNYRFMMNQIPLPKLDYDDDADDDDAI
ncbi:senescence-associated protein SPA15, chloroplastic isoform X1 [Cynara cardunculus var. scolymus]|uniref:senescence-associated protein SPA15, chloroplastic isoform X1 n=1 Tax=Cynara cardunculus var. scolymus TaxID=59895 RepID=UPI000D63082E|nr:senescence-associated protein SPA15, chloroplastic isoform X1 [Cynara cardunculus var. scolymus]XP_024973702.1 senescence-associated protein SPA15, chloroplastic isoform X1 [Cynara cardunculus var. scolymus]